MKNQGTDTAKNVRIERFKLHYISDDIWISGTSDVNALDKGETGFIAVHSEGGGGDATSSFDLLGIFSSVSKERGWPHGQGVAMTPAEIFLTYEGRNGSKYRTLATIIFHPIRHDHFDFTHVRRERFVDGAWQA